MKRENVLKIYTLWNNACRLLKAHNGMMPITKAYAVKVIEKAGMIDKDEGKPFAINGFRIEAPGDPPVGINPASWKIEGGFEFEDREHLERFRTDLKKAFDEYADDKCIVFVDQLCLPVGCIYNEAFVFTTKKIQLSKFAGCNFYCRFRAVFRHIK